MHHLYFGSPAIKAELKQQQQQQQQREWFVFKFMWHKALAAQEMRERLALPWDS